MCGHKEHLQGVLGKLTGTDASDQASRMDDLPDDSVALITGSLGDDIGESYAVYAAWPDGIADVDLLSVGEEIESEFGKKKV